MNLDIMRSNSLAASVLGLVQSTCHSHGPFALMMNATNKTKRHATATLLMLVFIPTLLQRPAAGLDVEWIGVSSSHDFFDPNFWVPSQVPTFADNAFIRNDNASQTNSAGTIQANSLIVGDAINSGDGVLFADVDTQIMDNLLVAAHSSSQQLPGTFVGVDGHFDLERTSLLSVGVGGSESDFHLAVVNVSNSSQANFEGTSDIDRVTTVTLADDLKMSAATNEGGLTEVHSSIDWRRVTDLSIAGDMDASLSDFRGTNSNAVGTGNGNGVINDVTNFQVGGNLGLGRHFFETGPAHPFRISHGSVVSFVGTAVTGGFHDIENFTIGGNVEIGTATVDIQTGAKSLNSDYRAVVEFHTIESMEIAGDLNVQQISGNVQPSPDEFQRVLSRVSNATNFFAVRDLDVGGAVNVGVVDVDSASSDPHLGYALEAATQLALQLTAMTTDGPMSVGVIAGNANVSGVFAGATLPMVGSSLITPELRLAVIEDPNVMGTVLAQVDMFPSLIVTDSLIQGEDATIEFHLDGLDRIDLATLDGAGFPTIEGYYSGIDAANALLEGTIISDFDFTPPGPGTYTFDLIQSDSLSAIDASMANLQVQDLPAGFTVCFYDVAQQGGADVLQLIISTNCVPEPSNLLGLLCGTISLLAVGRRTT